MMLLISLAAAVKSSSTAEDASTTHFDECTSMQIPHNAIPFKITGAAVLLLAVCWLAKVH